MSSVGSVSTDKVVHGEEVLSRVDFREDQAVESR